MSDIVCASLTRSLDVIADPAQDFLGHEDLPAALAAAAARRERLVREHGITVAESPYLHFLRRFAAEPVAPALAASA